MSSGSVTNKHTTKHKWIIHDFKDYFDVTYIRGNHVLLSSSFSVDKYCNQFRIELAFNSKSNPKQSKSEQATKWLSLSIREDAHTKNDKPKTIKYSVYCLDDKNSPCNIHEVKILTEIAADWSWPQFCDLTKLCNGDINLLSNNTFTIVCDVSIYARGSTSYPTYANNPKNLLKDDLGELFKSGKHSDITFILEKGIIKAHQLILMARSSFYDRLFSENLADTQATSGTREVCIRSTDFNTFKSMLKFIYTDELDELPGDDLLKLIIAASKYDVKNLLDACGKYFCTTITIDNVMETLKIAEAYNIENLKTYTTNFIKANKQRVLDTLSLDYFKANVQHALLFLF